MTNSLRDPALNASNQEKARAFEWLRDIAIGDTDDAWPATVLMYELERLKGNELFDGNPFG